MDQSSHQLIETNKLSKGTDDNNDEKKDDDVLSSIQESQCSPKYSFSQELEDHQHQTIFAFHYAEEITRKTLKTIYANENRHTEAISERSPLCNSDLIDANNPGTSNGNAMLVVYKTPHSRKRGSAVCKNKHLEVLTPPKTRKTPLPLLTWADSNEVWQNMVYKEEATINLRNSRLFENRSSFLPRMRAILLDWIMEVCEVYHLRRVTYYLAVDYVDRYLTINPNVPKTQLQLVGVSCLFIAAKVEEIYPPKMTEFAYVCDGACTLNEIFSCEVLILNSLGWDVHPMTPSEWLNLYMQIHYDAAKVKKQKMHKNLNREFLFPQYSVFQFVRASHLIDLFSLDPGFLRFSYSVISASAMYFIFGKQVAINVSGLGWDQLKHCVEYMTVFYKVIRDGADPKLETVPVLDLDERRLASFRAAKTSLPDLINDENQSIQTHTVDLDYFERATLLRLEQMGLRANKTYINRKKKLAEQYKKQQKKGKEEKEKEAVSESSQATDADEVAYVMFDIEKMNEKLPCEHIVDDSSSDSDLGTIPEDNSPEISAIDNVVIFEKKSRVSFDEILASINESTVNTLVQ